MPTRRALVAWAPTSTANTSMPRSAWNGSLRDRASDWIRAASASISTRAITSHCAPVTADWGCICATSGSAVLLKRDLGEAAQLAAVQLVDTGLAQQFDRADADAQVLIDPLAVEMIRHAGQLDLAVPRLVAHAQQRAVGYPKAKAVGGDRRRLHVERDRAALAEAALRRARRVARGQQLPVAVVGARHRAG